MEKPTAVDLFAGAGGLTLGLRQAGFNVLAGFELDDLAVETYQANHPGVLVWAGDIRNARVQSVRRVLGLRPGELDLLAACPPCQGFSTIRTHNRTALADDRNDLVLEIARFVRWLRPKAVMLENVPGIRTDERFRTLTLVLRRLGYTYRSRIIDAATYGVPQRRKRLVLIASRVGPIQIARSARRPTTVGEAFEALGVSVDREDPLSNHGESRSDRVRELIRSIPKDGGSRSALGDRQLSCHQRVKGFHDVYGRMALSEVSPTITGGCVNPSKGRFLHPEEDRAINLREAAFLQSFPADYRFSLRHGKYAAAEMIGNAFPAEVVRRQAIAVRRHLQTRGDLGRYRH